MWPNILRDGDPFYNINFTKEGKQFTLPEIIPTEEKPAEEKPTEEKSEEEKKEDE